MPEPTISAALSAFSAALTLWKWIYRNGFQSQIEYHDDYKQFRNSVGEFLINLQSVETEYKRAEIDTENHQVNERISQDLGFPFLKQVTGDFQQTLEECSNFLKEKEAYAHAGGGLHRRFRWNASNDRIRELRQRIVFHSIRLAQLVQPIQLRLTVDIRRAVDEGFDRMDRQFDQLRRLLGDRVEEGRSRMQASHLPEVCGYLKGRFDQQQRDDNDLPVNDTVRVSSMLGHVAKVDPISLTPPDQGQILQRYVDLMKVVWILRKFESSDASHVADENSTLSVLVQNTKAEVAKGLKDFKPEGSFNVPSEDEILDMPDVNYKLWLFPPGSRPLRTRATDDTEELLMEATLIGSTVTEKIELVVAAALQNRNLLRIVVTTLDQIGRSSNRVSYPVDVGALSLIPTYAQPGAEVLNVQLRTASADDQDKLFGFLYLHELFRFQRCLTGYEVKHDQPNFHTLSYKRSGFGMFAGMTHLCREGDFGRVQIWFHSPLNRQSASFQSWNDTPASTLLAPSQGSKSEHSRRRSQASSGRSKPLSVNKHVSTNAPTSRLTSHSARDTAAEEIPRLEKPRIVFFISIPDVSNPLTRRESAIFNPKKLRFFSIVISESTKIDKSACNCDRDDANCRYLIIKGSNVQTRLYEFQEDLSLWNLAALGAYNHKDKDYNCEKIESLDRIVIVFHDADDRRRFAVDLEKARDLYDKRNTERDQSLMKLSRDEVIRQKA